MAKTKEAKAAIKAAEENINIDTNNSNNEIMNEPDKKESEVVINSPSMPQQSGPSYNELLDIVRQLSNEVASLKASNLSAPTEVLNSHSDSFSSSKADQILDILANRKSDREVVLVHGCEMNGNLTTHIALTGVSIDFRHVGEQRVVSWQQFEECVSKYHSFFEMGILKLGKDYEELAEQYGLPYIKDSKYHTLSRKDIEALPTMSIRELEDLVTSLNDTDRDTLMSYWLGKCYERKEGFYDRYKMDTLNRLSGSGAFDNLLLVMNGESIQ